MHATLSNDKGYVYSEFALGVETVLKNDALALINSDGQVVVEREGGAVRFPSGHATWNYLLGTSSAFVY